MRESARRALSWQRGSQALYSGTIGVPLWSRTLPQGFVRTRVRADRAGSSAALGLIKVRDSCEKLQVTRRSSEGSHAQNYGKSKDAAGAKAIAPEEALKLCAELLPQLKDEQTEATHWLQGMCGIQTA